MNNKAKILNWQDYKSCEKGAVAVEYSVIVGAMFLAISPAFYILRDQIWSKFAALGAAVSN